MNLLKKITLKVISSVDLEKTAKEMKEKEKRALVRVYGIVNSHDLGSTQYGDFLRFKGNFEAVDLATGDVYRSGQAILPQVAEDLLHAALVAAGGESVQFGFELGIKESKNSKTGYELTASPLIKESPNDPLALMREQIGLPAPEAPKEPEAPKTGGKTK